MDRPEQTLAPQYVQLSGDAFSRGRLLGSATRQRIEHSLETYQRLFSCCDIRWPQAISQSQRFLDPTLKFSAACVEELKGMADGAGVDFESLFALNCRTEILPADFLTRVMHSESALSADPESAVSSSDQSDQAGGVYANECTSLAATANSESIWLAQNWDWCGLQRKALCVVEHLQSGRSCITVTEAGMCAKIGINSHGLGITLNILRSDEDGRKPGVPVHVLLRDMLDCQSVQQVRERIAGLSFSSSSNVMVADQSGDVASFELSPHGYQVLSADNDCLCHTNHFLHQSLVGHDVGRPGNQSTINRLERAEQRVSGSMQLNDIIDLLSDQSDGLESICRFPDTTLPAIAQIETVCSVIMNLSRLTLSVSHAQPSISTFDQYSLNPD